MQLSPLDAILVGSRQRKSFNETALRELENSIETHGLLHPLVCANAPDGLFLVAGERRLRAIAALHAASRPFKCNNEPIAPPLIPYILISDTEAIGLREAELEENIQREDLTWQERITALDELHKLHSAANPEQTVSDTAKVVTSSAPGASHRTARREIARAQLIAPHLDDPSVAAASSATDALAIVARKVEAEFVEEMHRRGIGKTTPHTLIAGSLEEHLLLLPEAHFTCIIADPPYGMGADEFGDVAKLTHSYDDNQAAAVELALHIAFETLRITCAEAHLYLFCDIELFVPLRDAIHSEDGWKVWRTPIIWNKGATGYAPSGPAGLRRSYELILWARKGGKGFGQVHSDVIEVPTVRDKIHAAQKPVELYKILLKRSCLPGDSVLDPCCGCGTIFPAATLANVKATGIEDHTRTATLARLRLEE